MSPAELLRWARSYKVAVEASVSPEGQPQAAVVGIAVSDSWEIIFDTVGSSRKAPYLRANPKVALVIGGLLPGDERTLQYEGIADEPTGDELTRVREIYFRVYPDGRERLAWPGITHFRVRPTWIRYTDYSRNPPEVLELRPDAYG